MGCDQSCHETAPWIVQFLVWHLFPCNGLSIIIVHSIRAVLSILLIYPSYTGEHLKLVKWAFNPVGKKPIRTKRHRPPNRPCFWNFIARLIYLPFIIVFKIVNLVVYILSGFLMMLLCLGEDRFIKSWCNGIHWQTYFETHEMRWWIKIVDQNYQYPKPKSISTVYAPLKSCKIILKTDNGWLSEVYSMYLFAESDNSMHCSYVVSMSEDEELITFHSEPIDDYDDKIALKTCYGTYLYATENGSFSHMKSTNPNGMIYGHSKEFIFTVEKIRDEPEKFAYRFQSCYGNYLNDGLGFEKNVYCDKSSPYGDQYPNRGTRIDGFTVYVMEYTGVDIEVGHDQTTIDDNDDVAISAAHMRKIEKDENAAPPIYEETEDEQLESVANATNMVNENEVGIWLKSLGGAYYDDYYTLFIDTGYDQMKIVETMTDDELQQIGVHKMGHRRNLIMQFAKLSNHE
eukprot:416561_1